MGDTEVVQWVKSSHWRHWSMSGLVGTLGSEHAGGASGQQRTIGNPRRHLGSFGLGVAPTFGDSRTAGEQVFLFLQTTTHLDAER